MAPLISRLNDVFNKNAGKVVDAIELEDAIYNNLKRSLNENELEVLGDTNALPAAASDDPLLRARVKRKVGDGSIGVYSDGSSIFISSYTLEHTEKYLQGVPAPLRERVADAFAHAFEQCRDYSADVKNGKLKPLSKALITS